MPQPDAVLTAKSALAKANKDFPSPVGVKATAKSAAAAPVKTTPTLGDELNAKMQNVNQYVANVPKMHKGGIVPGKKGEDVHIIAKAGEKVIPADKEPKGAQGRDSEYRKVYIARRQSRQGGGNKPVTGEKHDQKKAIKGQPAGAGRTPSMKE